MTQVSVVVGLTSGETAVLRRCLKALHNQTSTSTLEVLVPYDEPCAHVATLQSEFPHVRFLKMEGLDTSHARSGASRQHHDALRTVGIRASTGDIIALTEDHAYVTETWCEELVGTLERHPAAAAVGGPIDCDNESRLAWAVWFCDFGRYQSPLPDGPARSLSDTNVAYRRNALQQVADLLASDYHEPAVHAALLAAGFELRTRAGMNVRQARPPIPLGSALRERYVWGRSFAGKRAEMIGGGRWVLALLTPLLPIVLTFRVARVTIARQRNVRRLLACLPLIVVLQCAWACGELAGYVTSEAG